jgi:transcriptional regulator with XRE-family HTH domain
MARTVRKLGVNLFSLMQEAGISREEFAKKLNFSFRDICRVTEGKLLLPPRELSRIAEALGTTVSEISNKEADYTIPELRYMKEFSDSEHLDKILDLIDEYVELRESV